MLCSNDPMTIRRPGIEDLRPIADAYGLGLSDADLASFAGLIGPMLAAYDVLDTLAEPVLLPVGYPRDGGRAPLPDENPLGAWAWRGEVDGEADGPLAGKRVAVKDNICVAGMPMVNGSATLEGYVPDVDATVVTRTLAAGGRILGKATCEDLCVSAGSHTAHAGPVRNPRDPGRSAGGSSGGSAALVAAGEVDLALGGDQGGSIRVPAAFCGVLGLKPTWGLVPYTGIFPIEPSLDHVGPMAATVPDLAAYLQALAGADDFDPRQPSAALAPSAYTRMLSRADLSGVRVGLVEEGFGLDGSEPEVDDAVRDAAHRLEKAGAVVSVVSVPWHRLGPAIWTPVIFEGAAALMVRGNGLGWGWKGVYPAGLLDTFARGLATRAAELSETVKLLVLAAEHVHREAGNRYYAKGQNLVHALRDAYDEVLTHQVDVLAMPTAPMRPTLLPGPGASREEYVARALEAIPNTAPFDATGHPALSVPCQPAGSLPIGMQLIGRHFGDGLLLRVANAYEELVGGFRG